jgi:hypothetical protein
VTFAVQKEMGKLPMFAETLEDVQLMSMVVLRIGQGLL